MTRPRPDSEPSPPAVAAGSGQRSSGVIPLPPHISPARGVVGLFVFGHVGLSISAFSAYSWADGKWRADSSLHQIDYRAVVLAIGGLLLVARRTPRTMLLGIASSGHLIMDRMWSNPTILLWPFLGWEFAAEYPGLGEWASGHLTDLLTFFTDFPELFGFLAIVGFTAQILRPGNLRRFLATGAAVSPPRIGP